MKRAVATAADMVGAAPIHELEAPRCRQQDIPGGGAPQSRPDPRQRVRVLAAQEPPVVDLAEQCREVPVQIPPAAAIVGDLIAGREPKLPAAAADNGLLALGPGEPQNQVDA